MIMVSQIRVVSMVWTAAASTGQCTQSILRPKH